MSNVNNNLMMDKVKAKVDLVDKYRTLAKKAKEKGVKFTDVKHILLPTFQVDYKKRRRIKVCLFVTVFLVGVLSSVAAYFFKDALEDALDIGSFPCLIENNELTIEMARPLSTCDLCKNLDSVPVEHGISAKEFKRKFAYSSIPVLIKDATGDWLAMSTFSYDFLKKLYTEKEGAFNSVDQQCQFFPYKTDFSTLRDAFNMSDARANFSEGEAPWYIGWSNCNNEVKNELRNHYERPYFLPNDSESSSLDWIFMGGSGPGALIHLDYVQRPSWQAQISGKKTWTLIPPPECENVCKALNVTVHKGDIFVIDTNVWYHSTFIHPGEISITIGSEYD